MLLRNMLKCQILNCQIPYWKQFINFNQIKTTTQYIAAKNMFVKKTQMSYKGCLLNTFPHKYNLTQLYLLIQFI